jgi:hypothetical protein
MKTPAQPGDFGWSGPPDLRRVVLHLHDNQHQPTRQTPVPHPSKALGSLREELAAIELFLTMPTTLDVEVRWRRARRKCIPHASSQPNWRNQ